MVPWNNWFQLSKINVKLLFSKSVIKSHTLNQCGRVYKTWNESNTENAQQNNVRIAQLHCNPSCGTSTETEDNKLSSQNLWKQLRKYHNYLCKFSFSKFFQIHHLFICFSFGNFDCSGCVVLKLMIFHSESMEMKASKWLHTKRKPNQNPDVGSCAERCNAMAWLNAHMISL